MEDAAPAAIKAAQSSVFVLILCVLFAVCVMKMTESNGCVNHFFKIFSLIFERDLLILSHLPLSLFYLQTQITPSRAIWKAVFNPNHLGFPLLETYLDCNVSGL